MYKSESVLGLVGSILAAVFSFLCLVGSLLIYLFIDYLEPFILDHVSRALEFLRFPSMTLIDFVSGVFVILVAISFLISAASFILGFIGTAQLKKDQRSGGVLLIVGAALSFISVVGFIPFVLMLIGGIMALSKKPAAPAPNNRQ